MNFIKVALVALVFLVSNNSVSGEELAQKDVDSIMQDGGIILNPESKSMKKYVYFPTRLSYTGGNRICEKNKLKLPSILTEDDHGDLSEVLTKHFIPEAWTSGIWSAPKKSFVWKNTAGQPIIPYNEGDFFPYWASKPTETSGCVVLKTNFGPETGYKLNVEINCNKAKHIVCETR